MIYVVKFILFFLVRNSNSPFVLLFKFLSQSGNVEYEDEIDAIQREATLLRKKGINILIALGHSGWLKDLEIAEKIKDIDIVVGGHTNTFLFTGRKIKNYYKKIN